MTSPKAEISSISTMLEDITHRVGSLAERVAKEGDEVLAAELYEVERSLHGGSRRLSRIAQPR